MKQAQKKPSYVYVLREVDGDPSLVKIGHSIDPINRLAGYKAGNHRRLFVLLTLIGGQPLEAEIHFRFAEYRTGEGGDEWFKLSPDLVRFLQSKVHDVLSEDTVLVFHKRHFDGPISIPTVELGEVKTRTAHTVARLDSVQPCSITEAQPPKDSRHKVGQKRQQ